MIILFDLLSNYSPCTTTWYSESKKHYHVINKDQHVKNTLPYNKMHILGKKRRGKKKKSNQLYVQFLYFEIINVILFNSLAAPSSPGMKGEVHS